jgi:hypothetical protein
MTQLSEPGPSQNTPPSPTTNNPSVSQKLTTLFKNLFESASLNQPQNNTNSNPKSDKKDPNKNQHHNNPDTKKTPTNPSQKKFTLDPNEFTNIFPELGIQSLTQIEQIIVNVTSHIKTASTTPNMLQKFIIQLKQFAPSPLEINISNKNNQTIIQLNCNGELNQILSQNLPELKKHLRKKAIDFDEILLDSTESTPLPTSHTP